MTGTMRGEMRTTVDLRAGEAHDGNPDLAGRRRRLMASWRPGREDNERGETATIRTDADQVERLG